MGWESSCPCFSSLVSASAWLHVSYHTPYSAYVCSFSVGPAGTAVVAEDTAGQLSLGHHLATLLTVVTPQSTSLLLQNWPLKSIVRQDLLISMALEGASLGFAEPKLESCKPQTLNSVRALFSGPNCLLWSLFYWMSKWVLTKLERKLCRFSSCDLT